LTTIGSLFSGVGGIELGLESIGLGPVLWQCDADPAARAVLAAHRPGVQVFEDVREIDAKSAAPVGIVCGGFPCQPHSVAGRRRGTSDARWLWPQFQRIVAELCPPIVFIENVPGLRTSGLRDVLAGLASLGFDAQWDCFTASEVGAPHIRRRLFVLAYTDRAALGLQLGRRRGSGGKEAPLARLDGRAQHLADADGKGQLLQAAELFAGGIGPGHRCEALADAPGPGLAIGIKQPARQKRAPSKRGRSQGHPWPAEPDVGRVAYGVPARTHRLRLLGNACVPAQAAHAFLTLATRALV
jgi:DNA (cytosine-5)-methyltransferase 1